LGARQGFRRNLILVGGFVAKLATTAVPGDLFA
jgi:hypothetical protein